MSFFNSLFTKFPAFLASLLLFVHFLAGAITGQVSFEGSPTPLQVPASTSTVVVVPPATTTVPQPPKTAAKPAQKALAVIAPVVPAPVAVAAPVPPAPSISSEDLNTQTRAALVNILCTTQAGGSFDPISGSGVFVDTRGIILTNAHVGQYFLLRNYLVPNNVVCVVRTGSPAQAAYTAELLYLPPAWIQANAAQIVSQQPSGTGQDDYAFLLVTGETDPSKTLPASFPALAMTSSEPSAGDQMLLASYPAGLLDGQTIQMNLYISSALTTVQQLFSFDNSQQVDVFSLGGTVVSQSGSSGGAAVRASDGKLVGIIATETTGTTTGSRELHAITIAHINRSLAAQGQGGIDALLSQDPATAANSFNQNSAPTERQQLTAVLNKT